MYYYSKRSRSKIVHQSTCQHIQNVSVEDVGSFENLEDAYAAGYRLCRHCSLSPSSTVRRAMCCRDTARAMPPLCFSKIGLLAFQHQSATGGSSPLAKAMRSCFIIKTPSATRRQALCLDITFSGLARTRFPATLSTSATMTSTVICTPSILFSQRKIALRQ